MMIDTTCFELAVVALRILDDSYGLMTLLCTIRHASLDSRSISYKAFSKNWEIQVVTH
jgi:hypothetical protein